ncbi:MAG: TolC family protein [Gemmataceae bacterium]
MPPDDLAAHDLSPNPQHPYKKSGIGLVEGTGYLVLLDQWDKMNRAEKAAQEAESRKRRGEDSKEEKKDDKKEEKKDGAAPPPRLVPPRPQPPVPGELPDAPKKEAAVKPAQYTEGMSAPPDDALPGEINRPETLSAQQLLERSEERARRELADAVTVNGPIPENIADNLVSRERTFLVKMNQAVELGLINSREYQTRRELVYLAALPVTLERFAFAPQAFAAGQAFRERFNRQVGNARRWRLESEGGFTQLFPSGALLLLSFANRTIFNLTNRPDTSVSTLSLDIVQPLLLGAGWAVTLEPLTQAERGLLYAIRDFYKFRQDFYVYIAGGQPNIAGIATDTGRINSGSVNIPDNFIPTPPGVVRPIGAPLGSPQVAPGDASRIFPGVEPAAPNQGYLGTLIEKAQLVNQYRNIVSLRRFLQLFRVYLEGGIVNTTQVNQVEQTLLRAIEDGLRQQANYRISIDQFKLQLGLPMNLRLEVEDEPLQPMLDQTRRYEDISNQYEQLSSRVQGYDNPDEADQLRGRLREMLTKSALVRRTTFSERIVKLLATWEQLPPAVGAMDPFEEKMRPLLRELEVLRNKEKELQKRDKGALSLQDERRLEEVLLQLNLGAYERSLRSYEKKPWKGSKEPLNDQRRLFGAVYQRFLALLEEPRRERQEPVRRGWPELPALCVDGVDLLSGDEDQVIAAVSRAALANRVDLMNRRAQLVDSWRKIAVAANALLGSFNVQYHMDARSPAGAFSPFDLGGAWTRRQFIIDTELPLVRMPQRNAYRATLITYQFQRRELQEAEDRVLFEARSQLRLLRASAYNYHRIQKRAVELAYEQVDQALQAFSQPQQPAGPDRGVFPGLVGPPTTGGGTGDPAALTQQLLNAQNSLLQAQNALYNTWIAYLITRMSLYREMGLMQLDPRGVWIDDVATCHCPRGESSQRGNSSGDQPARSGSGDELPSPRPVERLPAPTPVGPAGQ